MRILVFSTDDFLPPAGGAEIAFGQIAQRSPDISYDLVCARLRPSASMRQMIGNVTIHRIGLGIPWIDPFLLAIFGAPLGLVLHLRHRYDLVWAILASYGALAAVMVQMLIRRPFLLTLQEGSDTNLIERRTRWMSVPFHFIFRSADALQPISQYLLAWGRRMGFRGTVARVIPNGVDYELFHTALGSAPHEGTILISTSRLVAKNGLSDLIDALSLLPPSVRLVLIGEGPLRPLLEKQIHRLGLGDRVEIRGFLAHDHIASALKSADIFVRPSISEGLGNSFLEAMAAGVITVGTPVGGIVDFLVDGQTGFLCQPRNPASIARTIERILALDASARDRIRDAAAQTVRERFTWNRVVADMRELFTLVCRNA